MNLEDTLAGWTGPSSTTEQEKQERTERMIREAISAYGAFVDCDLKIYTKGSYANNTNVRSDSDVDIAVQCQELFYWGEAAPGTHVTTSPYRGIWTAGKFRAEVLAAVRAKFPGQVDASGSAALRIRSGTARAEADVVLCFDYRYYTTPNKYVMGSRVVKTNGALITNYPEQHLRNGRLKNKETSLRYKKIVRILKRVENSMATAHTNKELPSYFIESLVYNVPNSILIGPDWTGSVRRAIAHILTMLAGMSRP